MTDFAKVTLADVLADGGTVKTGPFGTVLKAAEYAGAGVPIISVGEVDYGSLRLRKDTPHAPVEVTERLPEYVLRAGDIVFGRKGAVDRSAWVKSSEDGWFLGSDGIRLRLPFDVNTRFFAYQFQNPTVREWLLQHASGSTMLSLNQRILERVPLVVPAREVQDAIAEVLGALDDKIAANTKLAETAATLAITSLAPFKAQTTQLQNLVSYKKVTIDPASVSAATVAHYSLPAFDVDESPEITSPSAIKSSKFSIEEPAVLISKLNPRFPRVWDVLDVPEIPALASTEFLVLEPIATSTSVLWAILSQADFGMRLESKVAGTSGSHQRVKPADLLATEAISSEFVPLGIQQSITSLGASIAALREESRTLAATRDALLPQLMSGKLRVKDIEQTMGEMV